MLMALFALELLFVWAGKRYSFMTQSPERRSSHKEPTVTGGGFVFYLSGMVFCFLAPGDYTYLGCALTVVALVSLRDDFSPLPIAFRLIAQFLGSWLLLEQLAPGLGRWQCGLAMFTAVAYMNAYNFMDGINGITSLYSLVLLGALGWLNAGLEFVDGQFIGLMSVAAIVFSCFNVRRRALCFSGDVGAITMAVATLYIIGSLIIRSGSLWWIVLVAVYGVDTLLTVVRRIIIGERIYTPHRRHLYQMMCNEGRMSHVSVALVYASLQGAIDVGAILLRDFLELYTPAVLVLLAVLYLSGVKKFGRPVS